MIGGGLTRFQPYQQDGKGGLDWKDLKKRAPVIARDVLTGTLTAGLKGLNSRTKSGKVNWKGVKKGALKSLKRKGAQEVARLTAKKVRKDIFGK